MLPVFDWLRGARGRCSLSLVSHSLQRTTNSDVLCVPVAVASCVDWGAALDRINQRVPSNSRCAERGIFGWLARWARSVPARWISLLGTELTGHCKRLDSLVYFKLVGSVDGSELCFLTELRAQS